ncbi:MAG: helix-turn-helix transcriptional regulator [Clostridia bacterium]|nr:helix-turn-helix transcriptional regulator [Clostridia bacterium]
MYGEQIKNWRKQHNLSQDKLSKATGIPQKTISWIESNEGIENIQQCVILADFYGISLDELIGREFKKNW